MVHIELKTALYFSVGLGGWEGRAATEGKRKKLDRYPGSTKRKTKVPDDYDDRNIPEVYICQETDLWQ